jgi:hypothetical protein
MLYPPLLHAVNWSDKGRYQQMLDPVLGRRLFRLLSQYDFALVLRQLLFNP